MLVSAVESLCQETSISSQSLHGTSNLESNTYDWMVTISNVTVLITILKFMSYENYVNYQSEDSCAYQMAI